MESIIFSDSPLAEYLRGAGVHHHESKSSQADDELTPPITDSFAPRGIPTVQHSRLRRKAPRPLSLNIPRRGTFTRIHNTCSRAVNSRVGRVDNARFLEQFRYIIIASQLLNDEHINTAQVYNGSLESPTNSAQSPDSPCIAPLGLRGALLTTIGAFGLVWILHWALGGNQRHFSKDRLGLAFTVLATAGLCFYAYIRRQRLHYLRQQAVDTASSFVNEAQQFDNVASAAITLIQEVELVSRGYKLNVPLPPVTRLEENSQNRRCSRLRRALHNCTASLLPLYRNASAILRPLAEEIDLERYYDIYDISTSDIEEAGLAYSYDEFDDAEALKALKALLYRLLVTRKMILCCLLALEADGGKPDFTRWSTAVEQIGDLSAATVGVSSKIRRILSEGEHFPLPPSPKLPVSPGREKVRSQLRKLGTLSQGIRSLQAKMHILREESDRTLSESEDVTELGSNLMAQYESIGSDLQSLMQEWESGKIALALNIDRRKSLSSTGLLSPTSSLGGTTAFEGSPSDALRVLNGEETSLRSSMEASSNNSSSSSEEEEVFEAISLITPRQRSTLSRSERIVKMKLERTRQIEIKEKAMENTTMIKELEQVIKSRPRGRTKGRITSL
ncbi:MAG: hypothetical protein M1812_002961 [Candelaria pacifica]|nr:MAG: hypothetical protein M1812_002961 [Candelaria pacifica]